MTRLVNTMKRNNFVSLTWKYFQINISPIHFQKYAVQKLFEKAAGTYEKTPTRGIWNFYVKMQITVEAISPVWINKKIINGTEYRCS